MHRSKAEGQVLGAEGWCLPEWVWWLSEGGDDAVLGRDQALQGENKQAPSLSLLWGVCLKLHTCVCAHLGGCG